MFTFIFRKAELPWFAIVSPYFKVNSRDYSNNKLSWLPYNSHTLNFIVWHIIYPLMIFKVVVITVIMIIWQEKNSSAQFSWKYVELGCGCGLDVSKDASLMLRSNRNFNIPPPRANLGHLTVSCTCTRVVGNGNDNATNQWFDSLNEEK